MENNPLIIQCQKKKKNKPTHSDEIVNPVLAIAAKWQGQEKKKRWINIKTQQLSVKSLFKFVSLLWKLMVGLEAIQIDV